jgi:signal peptidase I
MKRFTPLLFVALLAACSQWTYRVPTAAMEPTIKAGDSIVTEQHYYSNHAVERFDIVIFNAPPSALLEGEKNQIYVKRVIGLGGEQIEIRQGAVFINGKRLREPFVTRPSDDDFGPVTIPEGEYFLLGDNHANSSDSRYWKPATIKQSDLLGKVTEIIHK